MRIHRGRKGERRSFAEGDYAALLTAAHHQLGGPIVLVWDNLNTHLSTAMRAFIRTHADWLSVYRLPSYAPELNPAEGVWANLKNSPGQPGRPQCRRPRTDRQDRTQAHAVPPGPDQRLPRRDRARPTGNVIPTVQSQ